MRGKKNKIQYYVYVIALDKKVVESKKFRLKNPSMSPRGKCYYVGQSYLNPEIRFQQHMRGYKSNSLVKKYGIKLCKRLFQKYNPITTRNEALIIEQELTEKLRRKGHGVWSN
ncbi:MAG: ribose-5-phosphate isomerase [Thermoplasmatota archaeon]